MSRPTDAERIQFLQRAIARGDFHIERNEVEYMQWMGLFKGYSVITGNVWGDSVRDILDDMIKMTEKQ